MILTPEEERALEGEYGEAVATSYRILIAIGEATNAERLIPIKWAHVSGVNYNTIGDSGLEFLKKISTDGKVRVKTTINPMGFDKKNPPKLSDHFIKKQLEIAQYYEKLGAIPSFSCIPYELNIIPEKGTQVSFAESSAAVLANSNLDVITNKESALSALASAITGKTTFSDLRIEENRTPQIAIVNECNLENELDYGLLGYFIGKTVRKSCTGLCNVSRNLESWNLKSLSAGIGTSGLCGMYKNIKSQTKIEKIEYGKREKGKILDELNTSEDGQLIAFGSPQLGFDEICKIHNILGGRKFTKPCKIFCPRPIFEKANQYGIIDSLQNSGAEFICDACTCLTPLINSKDFDSIVTNSVKAAYYMKTANKVSVALKDMKSIITNYVD